MNDYHRKNGTGGSEDPKYHDNPEGRRVRQVHLRNVYHYRRLRPWIRQIPHGDPEHLLDMHDFEPCTTSNMYGYTTNRLYPERLPPPKFASITTSTTRRVRLSSLGFDKTPSTTTFARYNYTKSGPTSALRTSVPLPSPRIESTTTSHRTRTVSFARFEGITTEMTVRG